MMATRDSILELKSVILKTLPDLRIRTYEELLLKLKKIGVTRAEDLKHVEANYISPPLKIIEAKKLLEAYSGLHTSTELIVRDKGDVTARYEYKLKQRDQELRLLELQKGIEADKMKYKIELEQMKAESERSTVTMVHGPSVTVVRGPTVTVVRGPTVKVVRGPTEKVLDAVRGGRGAAGTSQEEPSEDIEKKTSKSHLENLKQLEKYKKK